MTAQSEIDEVLAKLRGWTTTDDSRPLIWRDPNGALFQFCPSPSSDLNAMADVRKVIAEKGLAARFTIQVLRELRLADAIKASIGLNFHMLNASAEIQGHNEIGYSVDSPLASKISRPCGSNIPSVALLMVRSFCVSGG